VAAPPIAGHGAGRHEVVEAPTQGDSEARTFIREADWWRSVGGALRGRFTPEGQQLETEVTGQIPFSRLSEGVASFVGEIVRLRPSRIAPVASCE
jgi:hypothetical protein